MFTRVLAAIILCAPTCVQAQILGRTDPRMTLFPDSSIVDFHRLLHAPAGTHGFLGTNSAGHFVWPDGQRAKFWGINISNHSVFIPRDRIDQVVEVLAQSGVNMVRFEALDSIGGLLDTDDPDTSRNLNAERLRALDYWTYKLREKGIYYYLDLLDFRTFREKDGVAGSAQINRAAKPYAVFDSRLVELQKEYAHKLLQHKNQFTKLRYVDDPGLALLEICNEHGLFFKADTLDTLVEPYHTNLQRQWNQYLLQRYTGRDMLRQAWTDSGGVSSLQDSEDPNFGSVLLPDFNVQSDSSPRPDPFRRTQPRLRDGVEFLYRTQRAYFREMKDYLRELGVKIPITAVVSNDYVADVASAADEMDFTSENYYADHPSFSGADWQGSFYFNDTNPLRYSSVNQVAPWISALRWNNKPVVVREWDTVWPNRFRSVAIPEMLAYSGIQDYDAVLLFGYQIAGKPDQLSDFDHQADPTTWGLFALAAQSFLRGDIGAMHDQVRLVYTPDTLFKWPGTIGNLQRLAWFVRLSSARSDSAPAAQSPAAPVSLLPHRGQTPSLRLASTGTVTLSASRQPTVLNESPADPSKLPAILDELAAEGVPVSSSMLSGGTLASSTGGVVRRTGDGLLTINSPCTVAICGEFPSSSAVSVAGWNIRSATGAGALMVVSLDAKPLNRSLHYVLKMVTRAENTDQQVVAAQPSEPGRYKIVSWGHGPVITFGRQCSVPTVVSRGDRRVLQIGMIDGTWELWVDNDQATLYCDTPNIHGELFGIPFTTPDGAAITFTIPRTAMLHPLGVPAPPRTVRAKPIKPNGMGVRTKPMSAAFIRRIKEWQAHLRRLSANKKRRRAELRAAHLQVYAAASAKSRRSRRKQSAAHKLAHTSHRGHKPSAKPKHNTQRKRKRHK